MDFYKLGSKLKQARVTAGYSQPDTAQHLGVTFSNVSSWERGNSRIGIEAFLKVCTFYGIDAIQTLAESASDAESPAFPRPSSSFTNSAEKNLLETYRELNEDGREYIQKQMEFASAQPEYKKCNPHNPVEKTA